MSTLFNLCPAIVVLNDGETYTNLSGTYVYLCDESIDASQYDVSTFAEDIADDPGVQILSIERLVEMYLAFQNMNAHAFNVPVTVPGGNPTDVGGMPEINDYDDEDDDPYNWGK